MGLDENTLREMAEKQADAKREALIEREMEKLKSRSEKGGGET